MNKCWICEQKKEWKAEKYNAIRLKAIDYAKETEQTIAIYRQGANYAYGRPGECSGELIEFLSGHSDPAIKPVY